MLKNLFYSLLLLTIVCGCNLSSSTKAAEDDSLEFYPPAPGKMQKQLFRHYYRAVSALMDTTLLRSGFSGGILVAKDGEIIYEKYQGLIHLQKKDSLTDSTALHLASSSKPFTAVAILRMIQEKKLSLNDPLESFFPGFPYPGITVKMLLSHRSGLPNYVYFIANSKWDKKKYVSNSDVVDFMYRHKPNKSFSAGTRFSYSNTNYVLLALIIEKLNNKPFPEYMQENFFQPLGMEHSYFFTNADSARSAPSFNYNSHFWKNDFLDLTYGDKNMYSTPGDMLKWDMALSSEQLINKALLDSAFTPYSFEKPSVHNYGLGFRLLLLPNGKKVVYHFGRWHGFNAAFSKLPDEKVTIIILGNKFNRTVYNAAIKAYSVFGEYDRWHSAGEEETEGGSGGKN